MRTAPRMASGIMLGSAYERQYDLEREWIDSGVARYHSLVRRAVERGDGASLRASERMIVSWSLPLSSAVAASQDRIRRGLGGPNFAMFGDIALRLDAERTALIAMRRMVSTCLLRSNARLASLAYEIGRDVVEQIHHELYRDEYRRDKAAVGEVVRHVSPPVLRRWLKAKRREDFWSIKVCGAMGLWLVEVVLATCYVPREDGDPVPAFETFSTSDGSRQPHRVVALSAEADGQIESGHSVRSYLRPRLSAMIVPPMRWSVGDANQMVEGGYLSIRTPLVAKQSSAQTKAFRHSPPTHAIAGVNALSGVPMRINSRMLGVLKEVWETGGNIAGLPPMDKQPVPPKPEDDAAIAAWKREAAQIHRQNVVDRSVRFGLMAALDAVACMDEAGTIWQPHQIDFRGRCYAMPLAANHQMGDAIRSLWMFDDGPPADIRWLRIHAANCWGADKITLAERERWVLDNASMVAEVAADPTSEDAMQHWTRADQPFQFVAACMALHDSAIGRRLPVQIDGTANGLQHYAAVGRDRVAAAAVNMAMGDTVADPYLTVLAIVKRAVAADANSGVEHAIRVLPWCLRSVVKQTIMTVPYNVSRIGAGRQVRDNLRKAGMSGTAREVGGAAGYLSGVVLNSIGEVFSSATRIMRWLEAAGRAICHADRRRTIAWTTPCGLRVVQPYMQSHSIRIRSQQYSLMYRLDSETNDIGAQVRGLPPNWVHSLDGDHFRCIAIRCEQEGIPFAGVHDSAWAPSGHLDRLNQIVREEFMVVHGGDPLAALRAEWEQEYGVTLDDPPPRGDWDLSEALASPYMFS